VKRRHALAVALGPVLAARSTRAQAKLPRVVLILTGDAAGTAAFSTAFAEGMRQAGQVEGRTWRFDVRLGEGEPARSAQHLKQAVASRADVLVVGGLILARQALEATSTIPVVVATGGNLVEAGLVKSLARPGGNLTGISDLADEATLKRLELTRVALPKAARLALLSRPRRASKRAWSRRRANSASRSCVRRPPTGRRWCARSTACARRRPTCCW
jgi:putative tryptophan/tyrosine transport system substrate-binding protein